MTIILDLFGPYDSSQLYKAAPGQALIGMTGKEPYKRKAKFYYFGICNGNAANSASSKAPTVKRERRYWICQVAHAPVLLNNVLELAEYAISNFWRPVYKEQKPPVALPAEPLTMVVRFFKANRTPRAAKPSLHAGSISTVLHWSGKGWSIGKGLFTPYGF